MFTTLSSNDPPPTPDPEMPSPSDACPATLELNDIVVTIGNTAKEDDKHDALPSYQYDEPTEDNEVACWVPVVPGRRFCIHVGYDGDSLPYQNAGLRALVYIDGIGPLAGTFIKPKDILKRIEQKAKDKPITAGEMEMTGQELDNNYIRPFCFSVRQTVEAESNVPPMNIEYFGEVSVEVYWATELPPDETEPEDLREEHFRILSRPIDEKLKHIQHRFAAGLDERVIDEEPGGWRYSEFKPFDNEEVFWFSFNYRDIEWLKLQGIAPNQM